MNPRFPGAPPDPSGGQPSLQEEPTLLAMRAHYPCETCSPATGISSMCEQGQDLYVAFLRATGGTAENTASVRWYEKHRGDTQLGKVSAPPEATATSAPAAADRAGDVPRRRVIANEDFTLYRRHGWEVCPDHAPIGGGPTADSAGTWRDNRVVVRRARPDATIPTFGRSGPTPLPAGGEVPHVECVCPFPREMCPCCFNECPACESAAPGRPRTKQTRAAAPATPPAAGPPGGEVPPRTSEEFAAGLPDPGTGMLAASALPSGDGAGKCSVPMWCGGVPAGLCDQPAFGHQRKRRPGEPEMEYAPGPACPGHGGPPAAMPTDPSIREARLPAIAAPFERAGMMPEGPEVPICACCDERPSAIHDVRIRAVALEEAARVAEASKFPTDREATAYNAACQDIANAIRSLAASAPLPALTREAIERETVEAVVAWLREQGRPVVADMLREGRPNWRRFLRPTPDPKGACSSYSPMGRITGPDGEDGHPSRCYTCGMAPSAHATPATGKGGAP